MSCISQYDIKHNLVLMKSHKVSTTYLVEFKLMCSCGNFTPDDELFKLIKSFTFKFFVCFFDSLNQYLESIFYDGIF